MPVQSQFGGLSVGKDITVNVTLPGGAQLTIAGITDYDRKPKQKKLMSEQIDGITRTATIPQTWELTFSVDRVDGTLDDFFNLVEDQYFQGVTVQNCTILETIREVDQTLSIYRYEGCSLHFTDAGNWKADSFVKMKLGAECSRRKTVQ